MISIDTARGFVEEHGRDIDKARFAYHFRGGSRDELLEALSRYQNEDGGFGHGLEPDISAPDSNPMATAIALQICHEADVPRDHPLLQRTVKHLEDTQDDEGGWSFTEGVYRHELAPWFAGWEFTGINPACLLDGLLRDLGMGSEQLHQRVRERFDRAARPEDLLGDDYYAVYPYAFYFLPEWDHPARECFLGGLLWWLIRQHGEGKLPDAMHFFGFVRNPKTYTGRNLPPAILSAELDRLDGEQQSDGGWPSPYAEHWRAPITIDALLTLQAFGRL